MATLLLPADSLGGAYGKGWEQNIAAGCLRRRPPPRTSHTTTVALTGMTYTAPAAAVVGLV
jgi:hypothetical protein